MNKSILWIMIVLGTCLLIGGCRVQFKDDEREIIVEIEEEIVNVLMMDPNKVD